MVRQPSAAMEYAVVGLSAIAMVESARTASPSTEKKKGINQAEWDRMRSLAALSCQVQFMTLATNLRAHRLRFTARRIAAPILANMLVVKRSPILHSLHTSTRKMRRTTSSTLGLTLIELLVVLAILGILPH